MLGWPRAYLPVAVRYNARDTAFELRQPEYTNRLSLIGVLPGLRFINRKYACLSWHRRPFFPASCGQERLVFLGVPQGLEISLPWLILDEQDRE